MVERLDPLVIRMYDQHSTASLVKRVLGYELDGAYMIVGFDGWTGDRHGAGSSGRCRSSSELGARDLGREPGERWWNHRYDFYYPPLGFHLPAMYGTIETVGDVRPTSKRSTTPRRRRSRRTFGSHRRRATSATSRTGSRGARASTTASC